MTFGWSSSAGGLNFGSATEEVRARQILFPVETAHTGVMYFPWLAASAYTDEALTSLAVYDQFVRGLRTRYGTLHATAGDGLAPRFAVQPATGARNLLQYTDQFDNAYWLKLQSGNGSIAVVTSNAATDPEGNPTADRIDLTLNGSDLSSDLSYIVSGAFSTTAQAYTSRVYVKAVPGEEGKVILCRHVGSSSYTQITLTAQWQAVDITETSAGGNQTFGLTLRGEFFGASLSASFYLWRAHVEPGSSITSAQKVEQANNVSEANVPAMIYLAHDQVNDQLVVTLPDLGTGATIIYSDDTEITVLQNQTVGAGSYNLPTPTKLTSFAITSKTLSAAELAHVSNLINNRTGLYFLT